VGRVIVAGVGNVLHQDDGFGVEVVKRIAADVRSLPVGVELLDVGIGGMVLVQALEQACELLILVDVFQRGGAPGALYLLEPEVPDLESLSLHESRDYFADTHYATPMRALALARSLGRLPKRVVILGCEPEEAEDMGIGLNPAVAAAIEPACARVKALLVEWREGSSSRSVQHVWAGTN